MNTAESTRLIETKMWLSERQKSIKWLLVGVITFFSMGHGVEAQTIDIKNVDLTEDGTKGDRSINSEEVNSDGEEEKSTVIEIRRKKVGNEKKGANWELAEGSVDIQGDGATMNREAKKSWKKACQEWKAEFRRDNRENVIIAMNCGVPSCVGESGTTTCSSTATYKIKAKMN